MLGGWRFHNISVSWKMNFWRRVLGELFVAAGCARNRLSDEANKFRQGVCAWGLYSTASLTAYALMERVVLTCLPLVRYIIANADNSN